MRLFKICSVAIVLSAMTLSDAGAQTTTSAPPSPASGRPAIAAVPQTTPLVRRRHRRRFRQRNMGMAPYARMRSLRRTQPF
jgi:hypothetical protein